MRSHYRTIEPIRIKEEQAEDETYLNYERLEESKESDVSDAEAKPPDQAEDGSETDTADEAVQCMANEKKIKESKIPARKEPVTAKPSTYPRMVPYRRYYYDDDPKRPRRDDYKCYICKNRSHGTPEALSLHLNTCHTDLLPYTCTECVMEEVVIKSTLALNNHKRQHLNPLKCEHCDRRYSCKNNLAMHVQLYHSDNNSSLTCEHCGKVCASKPSLHHHMKLHTTAAACEICGKVFKERSKLKRHIQNRHEKLRKYECHICKKKLSTIHSVHIHIKSFHSEKKFKCSYCSKLFGTEVAQRMHEKKHLNNPKFEPQKNWTEYYTILEEDKHKPRLTQRKKCNLCGHVTRNIATHLGSKHFPTEYRCHICGAVFKKKASFEIHVQDHEHGKAHRCPICGREFSERRHLIEHLRTKKHREHPLAVALLSTVKKTIKTASSTKKKEAKSDDEGESVQEEVQTDFDIATDSFM